ncbi:hypothetical protein ES703_73980 [subsurface metagenome]
MPLEDLKARIDQLLEKGEEALSTRHSPPRGISAPDYVDEARFFQWKAGALSFLKTVFGDDNTHFQEFQNNCKYSRYPDALRGQSILKAVKEDIEGGYLIKLETLVSADVFSDFLEMAEYLLEQGYKDPAASLIGAVLEDGLRRIAKNNGITIRGRENISSLNQKIADAQIYNRIIQRRVQVWNEIRDNADHGNFSGYTSDLVNEMLNGVRNFLEQYL